MLLVTLSFLKQIMDVVYVASVGSQSFLSIGNVVLKFTNVLGHRS